LTFFESRLRLNFEDLQELNSYFKICEELGIKNLIIEPTDLKKKIDVKKKHSIKKLSPISIYFRNNIKVENINDFKNQIKKFNHSSDINSVESFNKEVQIHAARDSRVDLISFSNLNTVKTLSSGVLSLIKQNESFIEFSLAPLMIGNKRVQSKNFRTLYKSIRMARRENVKIIISGDFRSPFGMRNPRGLISTCNTLLEIPLKEVKDIFLVNPVKLIERAKIREDRSVLNGSILIKRKGD